jgi:hypothetical protein
MPNKKVLVIPDSNVFLKYRKTEKDFLRVAVYSEKLFPFQITDMMQKFYSNVFGMQSRWKLVGIYTGDNGLQKSKDNFSTLLKLCKSGKVDFIICNSSEHLADRIKTFKEVNIPIYMLEDNRIIE